MIRSVSRFRLAPLLVAGLLAGCAAGRPQVPYPAFVQADELPDVFLAAVPGVRAKQFAGNPQTRRSSNRIVFPANWSGTTGASPGKSLEIYVLHGTIRIGDLPLKPGGYAWFPPGFAGSNLSSEYGAEILWFLDDANPANEIRTPIIYSSEVVTWQPEPGIAGDSGLMVKELRHDRGSGARTWLLRMTPDARLAWRSRARSQEGYLIEGRYRGVECVGGRPARGEYTEGGYYLRPPDTIHGGPGERALETSTWLLRIKGEAPPRPAAACSP